MRSFSLASALLMLISLHGAAQTPSFLPLEDPLNLWLYHWEAASGSVLPTVFPLAADRMPGADASGASAPLALARDRTARFHTRILGTTPDSGVLLQTGGLLVGEALYLSENTETRVGGTVGLAGYLLPSVSLNQRISLWMSSDERQPTYFPSFHEGEEEGRHFYVDWAFVDWSHDWFTASFGRRPQRWGPGRFTQLLLSSNSPAIDMLWIRYGLGDGGSSFTGLTGSISSDSAVYLTAHRLELLPAQNLRIGLSEAILFRSSGLELAYLNPFIPWYPVQWNEREDDNALIALDATWVPVRGLSAYGEFLIDDYQYQSDRNRPNKLGWTIGVDAWVDPMDLGAVLEYTRINRYVYSQRKTWNYYLHHDMIIGSELGPDADRLTLSLSSSLLWPVAAELRLDHSRHGEGNVYEGWPDSAAAGQEFPSGIVEHTTGATVSLSYYPLDWLNAHGMFSRHWTRNADNQQGVDDDDTEGLIQLILRW